MNKKQLLLVLISLIQILMVGCKQNDKQTKSVITKYPNDNPQSKISYYINQKGDTILHGPIVYYYPDGNIEDSFNCVEDKKNGAYFRYDSIGRLFQKLNMVNDKKDGFSLLYYPNGHVEVEEFYMQDSIIYNRQFHPNDSLKSYALMKNAKETCYILIKDSLGNILENSGDSNLCKRL